MLTFIFLDGISQDLPGFFIVPLLGQESRILDGEEIEDVRRFGVGETFVKRLHDCHNKREKGDDRVNRMTVVIIATMDVVAVIVGAMALF